MKVDKKKKLVIAISSSIGGGAQKLMIDIAPYLSEKYDLLVTGGSDCHDSAKRPLGTAGVNEQEFKRLRQMVLCEEKKNR